MIPETLKKDGRPFENDKRSEKNDLKQKKMTKHIKDDDKKSQQKDVEMSQSLPSEKELKKKELDQVEESSQEEKVCITSRAKVIILIIVGIIVVAVALTLSLYFGLRPKMQIQHIGQPLMVATSEGEIFRIQNALLSEKNFFSQNLVVNVVVSQVISKICNPTSRLLQDQGTSTQTLQVDYYNIHSKIEKMGVQLTFDPNKKFYPGLDPIKFKSFFDQKYPRNNTTNNNLDGSNNMTLADYTQVMNEIWAEAFSYSENFNFSFLQTVDLAFNNQTNRFQIHEARAMRRMLFEATDLKWVQENRQNIVKEIKSIVLPVFNVVKYWGPEVGELIGGLIGGPLGCKIGYGIGQVAKFLISACVPSDQLVFRCSASDIAQAAKDTIMSSLIFIKDGVLSLIDQAKPIFNTIVDGAKNTFNDIWNKIKTWEAQPSSQIVSYMMVSGREVAVTSSETTPEAPKKWACFIGTTLVKEISKGFIQIKDLKEGDQILTIKNGQEKWTQVQGWLHKSHTASGIFHNITFGYNQWIGVTAKHNIAFEVQNQDFSYGFPADETQNKLLYPCSKRIVSKETFEQAGMYSPMTSESSYLVFTPDGKEAILAHDFANKRNPERYEWPMKIILGMSKLINGGHKLNKEGVHVAAEWLKTTFEAFIE